MDRKLCCACGVPEWLERGEEWESLLPPTFSGHDYAPPDRFTPSHFPSQCWVHRTGGISCNARQAMLRVRGEQLVRVLYDATWHQILAFASTISPKIRFEVFMLPGKGHELYVQPTIARLIKQRPSWSEPCTPQDVKEAAVFIAQEELPQDEIDIWLVQNMLSAD